MHRRSFKVASIHFESADKIALMLDWMDSNRSISTESSAGDPANGALLSDIHAPESAEMRPDLEKWLESLPKYPRLVEDWPILAQDSLPQQVWFCVFPDTEDKSATVFQYGRGSSTLFEYVERAPVLINYFSIYCSNTSLHVAEPCPNRW